MTSACATQPTVTMEQLRLLAGLDYTRVAELAGVCITTVSNLEQGKVKKLRAGTVEKVAQALLDALTAKGLNQYTFEEIFLVVLAERDRRRTR